jgi:hypothetical protein
VGETAKKTLAAALLAWLVARVLRRLLGVALLAVAAAGGLAVAERDGVDAGGDGRAVRCETRAIVRAAQQLRDSASSSSPTVIERRQRAPQHLGDCHVQPQRRAPRP